MDHFKKKKIFFEKHSINPKRSVGRLMLGNFMLDS